MSKPRCTKCDCPNTRVLSVATVRGAKRTRHECRGCNNRWTTWKGKPGPADPGSVDSLFRTTAVKPKNYSPAVSADMRSLIDAAVAAGQVTRCPTVRVEVGFRQYPFRVGTMGQQTGVEPRRT